MAPSAYDEIVVKATDENQTSENWEIILNLCDKVMEEGQEGAREVIASILKRLTHRLANVQLYALTLVEALSKNCSIEVHREIASKAFTQGLEKIITDRTTHDKVRKRALVLIAMWKTEFQKDTSLGLMEDCYNNLKAKNFKFDTPQEAPPPDVDDEIRRREEEELQKVLEMSLQDRGGRSQWAQYSVASGAAGASGSASSSNATAASSAKPATSTAKPTTSATTAPNPFAAPTYPSGYVPARTPSPHHSLPQQPQAYQNPQHQTSSSASLPSASAVAPTTTTTTTTTTATPAAVTLPTGGVVTRVRALHTFEPTEPGELGFEKGDIIKVVDRGYKDWWRGQLKGRTGIFPVNYVEPIPEPTPAELAKEAEQEAAVFAQAVNVEKLLSMLRSLDSAKDNLADNEEIQELYRSCMSLRPKVVKLIDKYSQKRADLVSMNESFVRARTIFDRMMEESLARHTGVYDQAPYRLAQQQQQYARPDSRARLPQDYAPTSPQSPYWPAAPPFNGFPAPPPAAAPAPGPAPAPGYPQQRPEPTPGYPQQRPEPAPGYPHQRPEPAPGYPNPPAGPAGAQPYGDPNAIYGAQPSHPQLPTLYGPQPQVQSPGQVQSPPPNAYPATSLPASAYQVTQPYSAQGPTPYPVQPQAQSQPLSQPQVQAHAQAQPQPQTQPQPQAQVQPQPYAQVQPQPHAQAQPQPQPQQQIQQPIQPLPYPGDNATQEPIQPLPYPGDNPIHQQQPQHQATQPQPQPQRQPSYTNQTAQATLPQYGAVSPGADVPTGIGSFGTQGPQPTQVQPTQVASPQSYTQPLAQQVSEPLPMQIQPHRQQTQREPQAQHQRQQSLPQGQPLGQQQAQPQHTQSQPQPQEQQQGGPPYIYDPKTTYADPNVQAWATYYANGGTDPQGAVYFVSVPGVTGPAAQATPSAGAGGDQAQGQAQARENTIPAQPQPQHGHTQSQSQQYQGYGTGIQSLPAQAGPDAGVPGTAAPMDDFMNLANPHPMATQDHGSQPQIQPLILATQKRYSLHDGPPPTGAGPGPGPGPDTNGTGGAPVGSTSPPPASSTPSWLIPKKNALSKSPQLGGY